MIILEDLSHEERKKYLEDRKRTNEEKTQEDILEWEVEARYRVKQTNIMKFEDVPVSNSSIRAQHHFFKNGNKVQNIIEESFYSFFPVLMHLDDFLSLSDQSKRNIMFEIGKDGKPLKIINKQELINNWDRFKKNDFSNSPFIKELKKVDINQVDKMISLGDKEINDDVLLIDNLNANIYFKEIFGQYLIKNFDDFNNEHFKTHSNFFPDIYVLGTLEYKGVEEDDHVIRFSKELNLNWDEINEHDMIKSYNKNYKPKLKYSFSEYEYCYSSRYVISKKDMLIEDLSVNISEEVKNNISNTINFNLKRIKL